MTDKATLESLLERVEKELEPDRELDLDLARLLVPDVICLRHNRDTGENEPFTHWEYTGSMDAAYALFKEVLPNWVVDDLSQNARDAGDPWGCRIAYYNGSHPSRNTWSESRWDYPSPAIPMLVAVLKALIDEAA